MALALFLLSTASQAQTAQAPRLTGTVWKWTGSLLNDGSTKTPGDPNRYLIEFAADGALSIQADCNRVTGAYRNNGNSLAITAGASTRAACPPGSLERDYVTQLGNVRSLLFKDGKLILEFQYDSGTMTFAPSAPAGLARTAWKIVSYNNGRQAVVSVTSGSQLTLSFGSGGKITGNGGCNDFTASYEFTETALKITQLASTKKACSTPGGVMEQEARYFASLTNATTYKIEGSRLTLRDASGAMQVVANH